MSLRVNSVGTLPTVVIMSLQVRLSLRLAGDGCGALYGVTFTLFAGDDGTLKLTDLCKQK